MTVELFSPGRKGHDFFHAASSAATHDFNDLQTVADAWKLFEKIPVLKLHGSVNDPSSIVLSHNRFLHEHPRFKTFMMTLIASNTILYMGSSLDDS